MLLTSLISIYMYYCDYWRGRLGCYIRRMWSALYSFNNTTDNRNVFEMGPWFLRKLIFCEKSYHEDSIHINEGLWICWQQLGMLPVSGIRMRLHNDLFTVTCIIDLPHWKENCSSKVSGVVNHLMIMSLWFIFFFSSFFMFCRKKKKKKATHKMPRKKRSRKRLSWIWL